jgi:hypothetical protein
MTKPSVLLQIGLTVSAAEAMNHHYIYVYVCMYRCIYVRKYRCIDVYIDVCIDCIDV